MARAVFLVGALALFACTDRESDCRHCAPSFASAELPVIGGGEDPARQLWIEIAADGKTTLNGTVLSSREQILPRAKAAVRENPDLRAWISADDGVSYGALMVVIDMLKQAGISRMAFGALEVSPR